ncbi:MAG: hypothetical protein HXY50_09160 [Ignavibacteriaceae bacterium]|nr:hypothetical protein [Ignavibacteriaceae bacterium]
MKLKVFLFLLTVQTIFPQYYGERTTEQNFEQSDLYFKSHYLNTFGIYNFKKIAVGFIDDPFLNLYLNPASFPDLSDDELLLYIDFRGDRTEVSIVNNYVVPLYYTDIAYRPYIDRRWFAVTRAEPEPIFSIGILNYPLKDITKNFFIGGTYQLINREEKFYSVPYGIYYPNYYYDALGVRAEGLSSVPITDRYAGKDELSTAAHLFSAFSGYKFNDEVSLGLSLNGVVHSRDGEYANNYKDEFGTQQDYDYASSYGQVRNQDYDHLDFSAGVIYSPSEKLKLGAKIGYLAGNAEQNYSSSSKYFYQYKKPDVTDEWNYSLSEYQNHQQWSQDGNSKYFSLNFTRYPGNNTEISGYYRYTNSNIDLTNSTNILDTSFYTSRYYSSWDTAYNSYNGRSFTSDKRVGTGKRKINMHEAMLSFLWKLTDKINVRTGVYYNYSNSTLNSSEPVTSVRKSDYHYNYKTSAYNYVYELLEIKTLEWEYEADNWTLQIPIVFNFTLNDHLEFMLGLNRILNGWEITDRTTAYFTKRERNNNGEITVENNFGERYTQPAEKITEDFAKVMMGLNVKLTKALKINLLLDPEFDDEFKLAQWWLGFTARL